MGFIRSDIDAFPLTRKSNFKLWKYMRIPVNFYLLMLLCKTDYTLTTFKLQYLN